MKRLAFLFIVSIIFSSNAFAEASVQEFMLDICRVADAQIKREFRSNHKDFDKYIELNKELDLIENKIKLEVDGLIEGRGEQDPPVDQLKKLARILSTFSNNPESDIQKLFQQYANGINFQEGLLKDIFPNFSTIGRPAFGDKLKGDAKFVFSDNKVVIEQDYQATLKDNAYNTNVYYKLLIVFDRNTGSFDTSVKLWKAFNEEYNDHSGHLFPALKSQNLKELTNDLGYGNLLGYMDIDDIRSKTAQMLSERNLLLKSKHHAECYAILYEIPTLEEDKISIALGNLGRRTQIEDKSQVVGGLGSEAHGEGKKDATKGIN